MPSTPFLDRPSRAVSVVLDDSILDAVDLIRSADPAMPSRSSVVRDLLGFALAITLDEDSRAAFIAACAEEAPTVDRPFELHVAT